jgi:site-specific recombinase XerD
MEWYHDLDLPEKLTEAARNPRERALASVLGKCFIRATEATRINLSDINYQKEALSIINLRERVRIGCSWCGERLAKRYRFCPTCGNKVAQTLQEKLEERRQRTIPIDRGTMDLIGRYLEWRRRFPYQGELLFPLSRQRIWQIIERLGRRIAFNGLHPESLRHLLAARWVNMGLDVKKLKFLMGYSSAVTHPPSFSFEQLKAEYEKLWEIRQDER